MQLGSSGKTLLQNLRKLFGGNHVDANDILPTSELTEKYTATAYVVWQFGHDLTTSTAKGNASVANGHFGYRTTPVRLIGTQTMLNRIGEVTATLCKAWDVSRENLGRER